MYYTVYKVTNNLNGKFYIGAHKTVNIEDGYMGSGNLIKRAIAKYGIENFTKEILAECSSVDEMFETERRLVEVSVHTYNLKEGGHGGWSHLSGKPQTRTKARIDGYKLTSEKLKGRSNNLISGIVKRLHSEGRIKYNNFPGRPHTDETKQKMSNSHKGKHIGSKNSQYGTMWITNGVESVKVKKDYVIPDGWYKGRKMK